MFIKKHETGIVEIYPWVDDETLTRANFLNGGRIEVFPEWLVNDTILAGKRVRCESRTFTREEWIEYCTRLNDGMMKAFEIEDETRTEKQDGLQA